ncbi:MAG: radical SAM protein [Desulfobacula sp.]|nr:radical SAM protein [Desulfobacula sp.]
MSCIWCHNPESQKMLDSKKNSDIQSVCDALMETIQKDLIFFDESGGGVTFSGGEPLCQPDLLFALADSCKALEIHTCLDTSGYAPFSILEKASRKVDMVLYDVKLAIDGTHRKYTGQPLGPVFDNLTRLSDQNTNLLLRWPLIPDITDTQENINGIIEFVKNNTRYRDINILPFHKAADGKYERLSLKNKMGKIQIPSEQSIRKTASIFKFHGFNVTLNG